MAKYAKAITVLVVGLIGYLLAKAGVDIPADKLTAVIGEIVTAAFVWLVPNQP